MSSSHGPVASELEQARTAPEFGAHTSLSEKLLAVAIRAQNFTGSTGIAVALTEGDEMICRANWGTSAPEVGARLSTEHSFTGLCVRTGEPVRCDDAQNDPRVNAEACSALGISAIAATPIRRGLKVIGVLAAFSDTPHAFTDKHLLILTTLAEVIVEILNDPSPSKPLPRAGDAVVEPAAEKNADAEEAQAPVTPALAPVIEMPRLEMPGVAPAMTKPLVTPAPTKREPVAFERIETKDVAEQTLPAAADPRRGKAARAGREPAKPMFASFASTESETAESLVFRALHNEFGGIRRWLLPAAVFAVFAVIAAAGWRLHKTRSTANAARVATATAPVSPVASSPVEPASESQPAAAPGTADSGHSPFSPPPMASMMPTKLGPPAPAPHPVEAVKPSASHPAEATAKPAPAVVVPAAGPVRQLKNNRGPASVPQQPSEPEPPQLTVLSAATLPNLSQPVPSTVGAPTSKVVPAQVLRRVEPEFPEIARRLHLSGTVVVAASITRDGKVSDVRWVRGNGVFRDSAIAAVKQWRYKPATLNGQPTESELQISLQYRPPSSQ